LEEAVLTIDRRDSWALLTLDRPERRNALSIALRDAVSDALDELADDERIHGVAITGAGGTFSAGWDLREFAAARTDPGLSERIWASGDRFHRTLLGFPLPLVAAVDGPAMAGAFDLAVCCDVRIASTAARFAHPEFTWTDVVYAPLEAAVGGAVARDLLLTGRELDAHEAMAAGVVSVVVEPDRLAAHLAGVMARIGAAPRDALRRTKAKAIGRAAIELRPTLQL
jgi:enoyl-CoA hydratase/carnithine racemase